MNAMAPCPKDSALMQTWEMYKLSEEYKNSRSWAVRYIPDDDPAEIERIRASGANPWTKEMKVQAVEGSLWAAFMHGWLDARTEIESIVGQALCETYRKVTGREPSDRLREAFEDAIRFNT